MADARDKTRDTSSIFAKKCTNCISVYQHVAQYIFKICRCRLPVETLLTSVQIQGAITQPCKFIVIVNESYIITCMHSLIVIVRVRVVKFPVGN